MFRLPHSHSRFSYSLSAIQHSPQPVLQFGMFSHLIRLLLSGLSLLFVALLICCDFCTLACVPIPGTTRPATPL